MPEPGMRWLFHVVRQDELSFPDGRYAPASLGTEGFVHASFRDVVHESARLYFPASAPLKVLAIDPRRLDARVERATTPRGPMPHILGPVPRDAVRVIELGEVSSHADFVTGTQIVLVAFSGMTLLDLVGPLDALSRIASMGFDASTRCEVVQLDRPGEPAWQGHGLSLSAARFRPPLDTTDLLVVPGGLGTRALEADREAIAYLATFAPNRIVASVCTGALLLGAAGRLKGHRATTHHTALDRLASFGATPMAARVVDEGQLVTAGGVTAGLDLGVHLVRRLCGDEFADRVAAQMELGARHEKDDRSLTNGFCEESEGGEASAKGPSP